MSQDFGQCFRIKPCFYASGRECVPECMKAVWIDMISLQKFSIANIILMWFCISFGSGEQIAFVFTAIQQKELNQKVRYWNSAYGVLGLGNAHDHLGFLD